MNVRFGEFRLDSETRQLLCSDAEVHLSPKAFELLRALLDVRPRVLSKAKLSERLWPETFVSEANLSVLIAEIRRVLGEAPRQTRFVRTVHRVGYAFCGTAVDVQSSSVPAGTGGRSYWLIKGTQRIALTEGDNVIGRDPSVTVWLDLPGVSRRHARLSVVEGQATIADLGSKNGTYLRENRVTSQAPLSDGDEIHIGPATLTFRMWSPTITTETQRLSGALPQAS
jgi:DNA-binding winged helix-turn-helix (wHTH) protein